MCNLCYLLENCRGETSFAQYWRKFIRPYEKIQNLLLLLPFGESYE